MLIDKLSFSCRAGILLPYPTDNLVLDVVLLVLFLGLETLRIFYGETPNTNIQTLPELNEDAHY